MGKNSGAMIGEALQSELAVRATEIPGLWHSLDGVTG